MTHWNEEECVSCGYYMEGQNRGFCRKHSSKAQERDRACPDFVTLYPHQCIYGCGIGYLSISEAYDEGGSVGPNDEVVCYHCANRESPSTEATGGKG